MVFEFQQQKCGEECGGGEAGLDTKVCEDIGDPPGACGERGDGEGEGGEEEEGRGNSGCLSEFASRRFAGVCVVLKCHAQDLSVACILSTAMEGLEVRGTRLRLAAVCLMSRREPCPSESPAISRALVPLEILSAKPERPCLRWRASGDCVAVPLRCLPAFCGTWRSDAAACCNVGC